MSLFTLDFGRADAESAGDIGHEVAQRMWVSLQLALPLFVLQVIASTAFALLLVMFRHTRLDFWGVVLCVLMLSISSLFYIIVGQFLFSRVLKLAPISGYAGGLDAVKFLVLPIALSLLARLGGEARLYRAMFLEEIGKDYVRTARAKGLAEHVGAVPPRAAQRADPDHHQRRRVPALRVPRQPGVRELLRHSRPRRLRHRGHRASRTSRSCARWCSSARCSTSRPTS